ncbi:hypothetical protein JTE90_006343 [Oedothorax gibbosus]|uniref:Sulfotransferase domain-containing protein n=1 Tax=Oedothorax gibbosus TaxID=931172 RepID=A0AAV6VX17_9ARAC|nr:hypothetical protein JTE90_006343 [Oedothorax gibbosus]
MDGRAPNCCICSSRVQIKRTLKKYYQSIYTCTVLLYERGRLMDRLNCENAKTLTTKATLKPRKKEVKKKTVKVPHLEKLHILPKTTISQEYLQTVLAEANHLITKSMIKKVLIISYFNSGSPKIGDILSQHPDVFFLNEPLYPFDSTPQRDGEEPISRRTISEATDYLSDVFECRLLESRMGYSEETNKKMAKKAYRDCSEQQSNVSECVQETCRSKNLVLAKVIRVYMQDIQGFLEKNRGRVKVILLQRDPRVNLHMRNRKVNSGSWTSGSDMFFQGRSLCSRMLNDVMNAKRLEGSGHDGFFKIVLFEHFLKNPESVLKGILSFIGLSSDPETVKMLLKNANAYKQLQKAKLNRWEWIPEDDEGLSVDKACKFFYKTSLYNPMVQTPGMVQRYNLCQYCD